MNLKCPKCGQSSRKRLVRVKSKKGKIYYYEAFVHRTHTHLIKISRNEAREISEQGKKKRLGLIEGPCPVCNKRRRYRIKLLKIKGPNGKIYNYKLYSHGSTRHYEKIDTNTKNGSYTEGRSKIESLLEMIINQFPIGKIFTVNQIINQIENKGSKMTYATLKDKLGQLVTVGYLHSSKNGGATYFTIPGSILELIFQCISVNITLTESKEGIFNEHITEYIIKNKSPVRLEYVPIEIITDLQASFESLNVVVKNLLTGEPLKISLLKDEPKAKLLHIYFREPLEPSSESHFSMQYKAEETGGNFVYAAGFEIRSARICVHYHSPIKVEFYQISSDRSTIVPLTSERTEGGSGVNYKSDCTEILNPPKFSIMQIKWRSTDR